MSKSDWRDAAPAMLKLNFCLAQCRPALVMLSDAGMIHDMTLEMLMTLALASYCEPVLKLLRKPFEQKEHREFELALHYKSVFGDET